MSNPDDTQPSTPEGPPGRVPEPPPPPLPPLPPVPPAGPAMSPPPSVPPRTVVRQQRESRRKSLSALALACFLAFAAIVGYTIGANKSTDSTSASSAFPTQQVPQYDPNTGSSSNGSSSSSGNGQQANIDVQSIAEKITPSVVNLVSSMDQGEAAGTGIIISSSGLVLTNNHVIASSTNLQAEVGASGDYHPVKVLGYDAEHDVALVQIEGASGLTAASLGDSSSVQTGDAIVALGNAGGKGGDPTVVSGSVTATGQSITASDQDGTNAERLSNLIQIDANIQPGDSGGPLVDADGKVVGMNAAASSSNGGFGFGGQSTNEGYAIPIEDASAIAKKIESGDGGATIHVGAHAAVIGVQVSSDGTSNGYGNPFGGNGDFGGSADQGTSTGNGAYVEDVQSGSGADEAGIEQGSTITAVDGDAVTSADQLRNLMVPYQPGDSVKVEWVDSSGQRHAATIELGSGAPT
jgi:S1-C subfamily serine protease